MNNPEPEPFDPSELALPEVLTEFERLILFGAPRPKPTPEEEAMAYAAIMIFRAYGGDNCAGDTEIDP